MTYCCCCVVKLSQPRSQGFLPFLYRPPDVKVRRPGNEVEAKSE